MRARGETKTKRAKREKKNKSRCSACLPSRARGLQQAISAQGYIAIQKSLLVYYGLPDKYGHRTGRAQFGFICYVPQAKLKVMGGVKVKVTGMGGGWGLGWNGLGMSRGKRRGPEDSLEMREREGRRRNLVEARRHAPHPCRISGGGRGEVVAKRLAAASYQSCGGGS